MFHCEPLSTRLELLWLLPLLPGNEIGNTTEASGPLIPDNENEGKKRVPPADGALAEAKDAIGCVFDPVVAGVESDL